MDELEFIFAKHVDTIKLWQFRHRSGLGSSACHVTHRIFSLQFCSKCILDLLRAGWVALPLILVEDVEEVVIRGTFARDRIENECLYFLKGLCVDKPVINILLL